MPGREKWTPQHWRRGCWVEAHTRNNGTKVKRHWRAGGNVKGHYCNLPPQKAGSMPRGPAHEGRVRPKATTISAHPTPENATLARAMELTGLWRVSAKTARHRPTAHLAAVTWTNADGSHHSWPQEPGPEGDENVISIVALIDVRQSGELETERYQLPTDMFRTPDGLLILTPSARGHAEAISKAVERFDTTSKDPTQKARDRNRLRTKLERHNPERAIANALEELIELAEPPNLPITHPVTVPAAGGRYVVTIAPMPGAQDRPAPQTDRAEPDRTPPPAQNTAPQR